MPGIKSLQLGGGREGGQEGTLGSGTHLLFAIYESSHRGGPGDTLESPHGETHGDFL